MQHSNPNCLALDSKRWTVAACVLADGQTRIIRYCARWNRGQGCYSLLRAHVRNIICRTQVLRFCVRAIY